jgi:hypothetical protein
LTDETHLYRVVQCPGQRVFTISDDAFERYWSSGLTSNTRGHVEVILEIKLIKEIVVAYWGNGKKMVPIRDP